MPLTVALLVARRELDILSPKVREIFEDFHQERLGNLAAIRFKTFKIDQVLDPLNGMPQNGKT